MQPNVFPGLGDDLTDADRTTLQGIVERVELRAGAKIAPDDGGLYGVESGVLAAILEAGRHSIEVQELDAGDLFGEEGFLDGQPQPCPVEVREDAVLHRLCPARFRGEVISRHGATASRLLLGLARRVTARVHEATIVSIGNTDDDDALEVVSHLAALRGTTPGEALAAARPHGGIPSRGRRPEEADESRRAVGLVARFLQPVGHDVYYALAERMEVRLFEENSEVVMQGEPANAIYLLLDGAVDVEVVDSQGKASVRGRLSPGMVFGQNAFLLGRERTATCRATCRCTVGIVGHHVVTGLIRAAGQGRVIGTKGIWWIAKQSTNDLRRLQSAWQERFQGDE